MKVFAFGDDKEIIGMTNITVGKSAVVNLEIEPEFPLESDSVFVSADFFDENGICQTDKFGNGYCLDGTL